MSEITVVELGPQLVLGMRKRGKYEIMATMIPQVCQFAVDEGLQIVGHPVFVCHETSVAEAEKANEEGTADVEIAVPIDRKIDDTDEIRCYELPGGTMAKIVHQGPYEECTPTYERLFAWIEAEGKRIAGPIREIYLNDPREVAPEEILTEIYVPIE